MSKLLSDEELAKYLADQEGYSNPNNLHTQALVKFVNTQKRLYAESVIGDDEAAAECSYLPPTLREMAGLSKDVRNQLRAEQRAKIKQMTNSTKEDSVGDMDVTRKLTIRGVIK